jgi:hypothetical protein
MNRRDAFEKRRLSNIRKTSMMAPPWMQTQATRDEERLHLFKAVSTNGKNMRIEKNRVVLAEKEELPKSVWNTGSIRHNMIQNPITVYETARNITTNPVRLLEWKEDLNKQRYDGKISNKIGHP